MFRLIAVVSLLLPLREVAATCMQSIELRSVLPDCRVPADGRWPSDLPITVVPVCGACCAAGGPPVRCHHDQIGCAGVPLSEVRVSRVTDRGTHPFEATFSNLELTCSGRTVAAFASTVPLPIGRYQLQIAIGGGPVEVVATPAQELPGAPLFTTTPPDKQPDRPPEKAQAKTVAKSEPRVGGACATCQAGGRRASVRGGGLSALVLALAGLVVGWRVLRAARARRR